MSFQEHNVAQDVLLIAAAVLFVAGGLVSLARLRWPGTKLRLAAKSLDYWGVCTAGAAVIWRCVQWGSAVPLNDNFQALAALGVMLAVFLMYVQRGGSFPGLDWFILPIVVLMLACAVVFGELRPGAYSMDSLWSRTHIASTFIGAAAFAVAAAVGCMYLVASARLRHKPPRSALNMASLERLERVAHSAAVLGFALLTIGMLTGFAKLLQAGPNTLLGRHPLTSPTVILGVGAWVVYGLALRTPITPSLRGRVSAVLSIIGFALMFGILIAIQYFPGGR